MMISTIHSESDTKMQKSIESLRNELIKIRTGRANASLLDPIKVDCYGSIMPVNQVASVSVLDSSNLVVTPWDKGNLSSIEKAIATSDLGLNPVNMGDSLRIPLPPLTEERRKELTKVLRAEVENAKVAVRNIRRDANNKVKDLLKRKEITEDDERRSSDNIQKATDKYIAQLDDLMSAKEKEIMEI